MSDKNPPDNQDELYQDPYDEDLSYGESFEDAPEVDSGASAVATAKAKSIIIIVLLVCISGVFLYKMLFSEEEELTEEEKMEMELAESQRTVPIDNLGEDKKIKTPEEEEQVLKKLEELPKPPDNQIIKIETATPIIMPDTEGLDVIPPAPPPAPAPVPAAIVGDRTRTPIQNTEGGGKLAPMIFGNDTSSRPAPSGGGGVGAAGLTEADQMEFAKRSVGSLVMGGGASGGGGGGGAAVGGGDGGAVGTGSSGGGSSTSGQGVSLFSSVSSTQSQGDIAQSKESTRISDLYRTIAQGKMIEGVLETAINTDVPGLLRAIVSRDIYSEQGRNVLIPRGSRLIGTYVSDVSRNQKRLSVTWNRIIRPDGVDITMEAGGTDRLGRAGVSGKIDNKYVELFGSTLLFSSIGAGVALIAEQFTDSDGTETTVSDGGTSQTTGSNVDVALSEMIDSVGSVGASVSSDLLDVQPTFTVNQGVVLKIYVTEDLFFHQVYRRK